MDKKVYLISVILGTLFLVYLFISANDTDSNLTNTSIENKKDLNIKKEQINEPIIAVEILEKEVLEVETKEIQKETLLKDINSNQEIVFVSKTDNLNLFELQFISKNKINLSDKNSAFFKVTINEYSTLHLKLSIDIVDNLDDIKLKIIDLKENKIFEFDPYIFGHIRANIFYEVTINTEEETFFVDEKEDLSRLKTLDMKEIDKIVKEKYELLDKPMPIRF